MFNARRNIKYRKINLLLNTFKYLLLFILRSYLILLQAISNK